MNESQTRHDHIGPTPDELWARIFHAPSAWRDRFAAVPFEYRDPMNILKRSPC